MSTQGSGGNVIAALCNIFIAGLGQLVQGRIIAAILFFLIVSSCYAMAATGFLFFMALPGVIFHLWSIISAARYSSH